MSRSLDDLNEHMRPLADALLTGCIGAGIPITVVGTGRTIDEQRANVAAGVSWTLASKHLTGDAIDVCPTALISEKWWAPRSPLWMQIGLIGESVGLKWGGRWKKTPDLAHFERKT